MLIKKKYANRVKEDYCALSIKKIIETKERTRINNVKKKRPRNDSNKYEQIIKKNKRKKNQ